MKGSSAIFMTWLLAAVGQRSTEVSETGADPGGGDRRRSASDEEGPSFAQAVGLTGGG